MTNHETIIERSDAGFTVEQIADELNLSPRRIYQVLKEHRPDRPRKPRACTSDLPRVIRGLAEQRWSVARISAVLGISRAYVYRHIP